MTKAEKIIKEHAGENAVGKIAWWSLHSSTFAKTNDAMRAAGILDADAEDALTPPAPNVALRRAVAQVQKRLDREAEDSPDRDRTLIRPITVNTKISEYGVLTEQMQKTGSTDPNFAHTYLAKFSAEKDKPLDVGKVDPSVRSVVERIREVYDHEIATCPTHKVSGVIVEETHKGDGISVRASGGMYFYPGETNDHLERIDALLEALDGCSLHTITIRDDGDSMVSLATAAQGNFLQEIDTIKDRVDAMKGKKRKSLENLRANEIADFRNRVALYRNLLGTGLGDVDASLADLEKMIADKLEEPLAGIADGDEKPAQDAQDAPQETEAPTDDQEVAPAPEKDQGDATETEPAGMTPEQEASLTKWKGKIETAIAQDGPYSHNIASLALAAIAKDCGVDTANAVVQEYALTEKFGIRPVEAV